MSTPTLYSTFLLTLLLAVGLFFFIRASVKERIQVTKLLSQQPQESLVQHLQEYFTQRAYRLATIDAEQNEVTYEGLVRPSWFLALFLTGLAAIGLLCLALVLAMAVPQIARAGLGLVLLAPIAGLFYWRKAQRPEQVKLQVEPMTDSTAGMQSFVVVTAHRDELIALQKALPLTIAD